MGAQGRRRDAFPVLLSSIQSAIYVWGAVIIIGLAVKIVPKEAVFLGSLFALAPRAGVLVTGALTGHRIVRVLFGLLRYRDPRLVRPTPPEQRGDDDGPLVLPAERPRRRTMG